MRHGLFATLFSRKFNSISCRANDKPVYIRSRHNSSTLIISRSFVPSPHLSASLRISPHLSASLRISPLPINSISPIQPNHLICVTDMNTPTAFLQTEIRLHENIFSLSLSFILSLSFFLFSFISCQLFPEISFQFFSLSIFWLVNEFLFLRKRSCHRCVLSK